MTETLSLFEPDRKQKWMCTGVFDQAGKINGGFHFRLLTRLPGAGDSSMVALTLPYRQPVVSSPPVSPPCTSLMRF
jgi:hypothetical protein